MSVTQVILPKLGLTMDEGTLVSWLKGEGDRVEQGEILFEVETDKSILEVEAPASGYLRSILTDAGQTVPVTQVIALISTTEDEPLGAPEPDTAWARAADGAGAEAAEEAGREPVPVMDPAATSTSAAAASAGSAAPGAERIVASPAARKRAQELGVDISQVKPSRGIRVMIEDVEAAAAAAATPAPAPASAPDRTTGGAASAASATAGPAAGERVPLSRMRRAIAERMTASFRDVPQFSVARDVDMTAASAARTAAGVSYADVLIEAVAQTLLDHRRFTMHYDGDALVAGDGIHIGLAVALPDGLIVPVLRDAERKDLTTIARDRADLQDRARAGKLPADAMAGAVFTISNLGQEDVDRFTAIVNPPEAAILAVGRVRDQVVVRDGGIHVAPTVTLTLSVDHRVAGGAEAAAFLAALAKRLEQRS